MIEMLCVREEAPEALYKNGTKIRKGDGDLDDITPKGTPGTILGSLYHHQMGVGYFVEWDDKPGMPVFVMERKLDGPRNR
jgi:hypothetical protein